MISNETHNKHSSANRASVGLFHRNELAILGTTCEDIQSIVALIRSLFPDRNIAYADESHRDEQTSTEKENSSWRKNQNSIQMDLQLPDNRFQRLFSLAHADAVLVNGNHFEARKQLIVCNPEKENSLRKRKDQLTHVAAILLTGAQVEVPSYVTEMVKPENVIHRDDLPKLKTFVEAHLLEAAPLCGLIMAGGKSVRMGQDKPTLNLHGSPQVLHLSGLLNQAGIKSIVSCREDQKDHFEKMGLQTVTDRISNFGPLGGIASAFMDNPDCAYLVLASDLPLIDEGMLQLLIRERKSGNNASAFISPHDALPEPLAAIWEPSSFQQIMQFIALGYTCPRKVLMNTRTHLIAPSEPEKLMNLNTPEDLQLFFERKSPS